MTTDTLNRGTNTCEDFDDLCFYNSPAFSRNWAEEAEEPISRRQKETLTLLIEQNIQGQEEKDRWLSEITSMTSQEGDEAIESFMVVRPIR